MDVAAQILTGGNHRAYNAQGCYARAYHGAGIALGSKLVDSNLIDIARNCVTGEAVHEDEDVCRRTHRLNVPRRQARRRINDYQIKTGLHMRVQEGLGEQVAHVPLGTWGLWRNQSKYPQEVGKQVVIRQWE
jgi:hypothetical protein